MGNGVLGANVVTPIQVCIEAEMSKTRTIMPTTAHAAIAPLPQVMPDVQGASDARNVAIDKVGVKAVRYPITLRQACGGEQHTVATINLYVSLPKHKKGTHMSRFLEILNAHHKSITPERIVPILHEMKRS